jgi:hypothetical protein
MSDPTPEQIRSILESGIRAPSADNHHRLRFEVQAYLSVTHGTRPDTVAFRVAFAMIVWLMSLRISAMTWATG